MSGGPRALAARGGAARARRFAPALLAAALGAAYLVLRPPSLDLAAHLLRVRLFEAEGFGLWSNWWYGGHDTPAYSVLFPPVGAALGPRLAAALAVVMAAGAFAALARERFGERAWVGSAWFALGAGAELYSGRLTFAFGLAPAVAAALALARGRTVVAALLGVLTALASPVAALFAALAGLASAAGGLTARRQPAGEPAVESSAARTLTVESQPTGTLTVASQPATSQPASGLTERAGGPATAAPGRETCGDTGAEASQGRARPLIAGIALALAALLPIGILAVLFPEGGSEPFAFSALWPILVIAALMVPLTVGALRAGVVLYAVGCLLAYGTATPVGGNAARLGELVAGPLAALVLTQRRRPWVLAAVALPLLYVQLQGAVRDVADASGPATSAAYYQPLLSFLAGRERPPTPPFRIEIPFTADHWEAYEVAPHFALARGWERQLDIEDNGLFYRPSLTPRSYEAWLHRLAVRFVAVPDTGLDYSARVEVALIDRGLPYLRLVWRSRHWRVYAVRDATAIVSGKARLRALGPDSLTIAARRPGRLLVRVRYTPYWALAGEPGCVAPAGDFTRLTLRRAGTVRLVIRFALDRVLSRSPRCS